MNPIPLRSERGQEAIKAGLRYRPVQTAALIIILLFDFLLAAVPALPFSTPLVHNLLQFADLTKKNKLDANCHILDFS